MREETRTSLIDHFAARAKPPLPKDVTDEHLACLSEAAWLRLAQGVEGYVPWLEGTDDTIRQVGRSVFRESLWREALQEVREALGEDHAHTGASYNNVASNLKAQARHTEAAALFRKGLEISRVALGETHAHTGESYNNVASNLAAQGRHAEAEALFEKALAIVQTALPAGHPYVVGFERNLEACRAARRRGGG